MIGGLCKVVKFGAVGGFGVGLTVYFCSTLTAVGHVREVFDLLRFGMIIPHLHRGERVGYNKGRIYKG